MEEKRNYHEPCACQTPQPSPAPIPQKPCSICHSIGGSCSCLPPKVVPVQTDGCPILFRRVEIPASAGDETTDPPVAGKYRNVLLVYEATGSAFLYSSDGIPTQLPQKGDKGDQGETGPQGPAGPAGPQGPQGETGPQGVQGEQGPQGPAGEDGAGISIAGTVATYADLPSGLTPEDEGKGYYVESEGRLYIWNGTAFPADGDGVHIQGPQGPQGIQGVQGEQGPQGIQGPAGANGADGVSPTATVTQTATGATITITDAQGTTTADIRNGQDGNVPIATTTVAGKVMPDGTTITVDANGVITATAQVPTLYPTTGQNTDGAMTQKATTDALALKADASSLAAVATSGAYSDLSGAPTIPTKTSDLTNDSGFITAASLPTVNDGTLTVTQGGTTLGTFTANQATAATINIPDAATVLYCGAWLANQVLYSDAVLTNMVTGQQVYDALRSGPVVIIQDNRVLNMHQCYMVLGYLQDGRNAPIKFLAASSEAEEMYELTYSDPSTTAYQYEVQRLQKELTAGSNITISNDTISATVPATNNITSTDWNALWQ